MLAPIYFPGAVRRKYQHAQRRYNNAFFRNSVAKIGFRKFYAGVDLLSRLLAEQVSSTLTSLTSLFGTGRGVPPSLKHQHKICET